MNIFSENTQTHKRNDKPFGYLYKVPKVLELFFDFVEEPNTRCLLFKGYKNPNLKEFYKVPPPHFSIFFVHFFDYRH